MKLTQRHQRIVELLERGPESDTNLALILDCPAPSIRRDIQQLRRWGYNISFAGNGEPYRMGDSV